MTITGSTMGSTDTPHTAQKIGDGWVVSWLPGRALTFNEACTAMSIAEAVGQGRAEPGSREWPHLEGWAGELGLSAEDAVTAVRRAAP